MNPSPRLLLAFAVCLAASPLAAQDIDDAAAVDKALKAAGKGAKASPQAPGGPAAGSNVAEVKTLADYNGLAKGRVILAVYSSAVQKEYEAKAKTALGKAASASGGSIAAGQFLDGKPSERTKDQAAVIAALRSRFSGAGCLHSAESGSPDSLPIFLLIENNNLARVANPPTDGEAVEKCCFFGTKPQTGNKTFADRLNRFVKACFPAEKK